MMDEIWDHYEHTVLFAIHSTFLGIAYNIPMLMLLRLRNFPPTFVAQMPFDAGGVPISAAKKGEPMDHRIRNWVKTWCRLVMSTSCPTIPKKS